MVPSLCIAKPLFLAKWGDNHKVFTTPAETIRTTFEALISQVQEFLEFRPSIPKPRIINLTASTSTINCLSGSLYDLSQLSENSS
jgi:hypothetical protein